MPILISFFSLSAAVLLFFATKAVLPFSFHHALYYCSMLVTPFIIALPSQLSTLVPDMLFAIIALILLRFLILFFATYRMALRLRNRSVRFSNNVLSYMHQEFQERIMFFDDPRPFAFTFGFFHPAIYLSSGLVRLLTKKELAAVVMHEAYHLSHHHALGRLLQNIAKIFFPVFPIVDDLIRYQIISEEIRADHAAWEKLRDVQPLLSAFQKLLLHPRPVFFSPSFAAYETIETRICALRQKRQHVRLSIWKLLGTVCSTWLFLFLIFLPVQAKTVTLPSYCSGKSCAAVCNEQQATIHTVPHFSLPATLLYTPEN